MHNFISRILIVISTLHFLTSSILCAETVPGNVDDALLAKIQKDSFKYFLDFTSPETGLTKDSSVPRSPASIAAVGFYLSSLVVAEHNGWISRKNAYARAKQTLETLKKKAVSKHGFYYHFLNPYTGKRTWNSELSSIDTALLLAGVLLVGEYFKDSAIEELSSDIYRRVDWPWMLNGTKLICHGNKPEQGFLPYYWDSYSEHLILQALAIGSPSHPIGKECWKAWQRNYDIVNDKKIVYSFTGSLFTYQYSHAFIDFRNLYDNGVNYYDNSKYATLANKEFCEQQATEYQTYKDGFWGLTASLGPDGYKAYGAAPGNALHDGTVAPYGAIASLPFTPDDSYTFITTLYSSYKNQLYGEYGFRDSFNVDRDWFSQDYLAIDQGITILMIENYRSNLIWKYFMQLPSIKKWIEACNLRNNK